MNKEKGLVVKLVEVLGKQNLTEEEKKLQALIKQALYADDMIAFVNEVQNVFKGCGKVSTESVKKAIEYAKAHNEVEIRNTSCSEEQKDEMTKQESARLTKVEVWILGSLAHFGLLK